MRLTQVRTGKHAPVNAPLLCFAKYRQVAEEALPGEVVGIANHGALGIGDSLTEGRRSTSAACPPSRQST